jgi:hypothetical protein
MTTATEKLVQEQEEQRFQRYLMYAVERWARKSFRIYARTFEEQEAADSMKLDLALMVDLDGKNSLQDVIVENMEGILRLLPKGVAVVHVETLQQCGAHPDVIMVASDYGRMHVARQAWECKDRRVASERADD